MCRRFLYYRGRCFLSTHCAKKCQPPGCAALINNISWPRNRFDMPKSNRNCAVGGCSHTQKTCPRGRFVGFPNQVKQPERRALWVQLVQRGSQWVPTKNSRVCGCHFTGGYKVDDPHDPAYNPSIFPPAPELDRRVQRQKTMMEKVYRLQTYQHQRHPTGDPTFGLTSQPSSNQDNSDDIMEIVSAALDLSKEAGEEYETAIQVETEASMSKPQPLDTSSSSIAGGMKEIGGHQLTTGHLESPSSTADNTAGSKLKMKAEGRMASDGQRTTGDQLAMNSSQGHGWLYINQSRPSGSAMNLACDSHELAWRRKKLLRSNKPQGTLRIQRFVAPNRKLSGNFSAAKHSKSLQTRHFVKTTSSSEVNRSRATDLAVCSSGQNATRDNQSQNHIHVPCWNGNRRSQVSVQTVLSMAISADNNSVLGLNSFPPQTHSRCFGFHGWSDICLSDTTVRSVAGVTPEIFNLLVGQLPDVMPGLPSHNSLLLFLMKLKMALPFEFLASVFGITAPTACNIFTHVLSVLITLLSDLVRWSSDPSSYLREDIPECSIIIDCLIIRTECPFPEHQLQMLSKRTSLDVVKVLVGFRPNGSIFFVSSAYGGCASNIDMFINSGIPDFLEKGNRVLLLYQDMGLQKTLTAKGFRVLAPPYSSPVLGQAALNRSTSTSKEELQPHTNKSLSELSKHPEQTELSTFSATDFKDNLPGSVDNILESVDGLLEEETPSSDFKNPNASHPKLGDTQPVRVYAGKIARRLRSFSILANMFESTLLPFIDEVVCVCAALNNLQEPVT